MKVEEVVPGGLPATGKLTLLLPKDDSASSSSDGADSGCLAESPEYGKEDSLCHSDVCVTPDLGRRQPAKHTRPSHGGLQAATDPHPSCHSKSSSTTSESSGNLGSDDWNNQSFPPQVVTSYIEINCNRNDVTNSSDNSKIDTNNINANDISSHDTNDNEMCDDTSDNQVAEQKDNSDQSHEDENRSTQESVDDNSNDAATLTVPSSESQVESPESYDAISVTSNASPALPINGNSTHEITLSLSQLSDFEITKQKIKEMRKSFLTKLAAEEAMADSHEAFDLNPPKPESSFLEHLQNKRASRMKMRVDSHKPMSGTGDYFAPPASHGPLVPQALSNFPPHLRKPYGKDTSEFSKDLVRHPIYHPDRGGSLKKSDQISTNLDVLNANAPINFHNHILQPSSLPPSISSSPIHYSPKSGQPLNALRVNSNPSSPYHVVLNQEYPRYSPVTVPSIPPPRIACPNDHRVSEYFLSRSADAKSFNSELFDYQKQYLRTRSLEEGCKPTKKTKSSSPGSSFRRVFSPHKSNKSGVSPLDCIKANTSTLVSESNKNHPDRHMYENVKDGRITDCPSAVSKSKNSRSDHSSMWLFEKTVQLLRLKKNGSKNKTLREMADHKSDSDSEYKEQKGKIKEACKDVARALFSLPNSPERTRETRSQSPPTIGGRIPPSVELDRESSLSRQVRRRQHLLSAAESSPRNSFHGSSSCSSGESCNCNDSRHGKCLSEGLQRSPAFMDGWQKISLINRPNSAPNIVTGDRKKRTSKSFHRRSNISGDKSSSDDDYADDYCQTDECPDDCEYCSGDDAGDEEEDVCDECETSKAVSSACKHSRVLTNGILKSCRDARRCGGREGNVKGGSRVAIELQDEQLQQQHGSMAASATVGALNGPVWVPQLAKRRRSAAPNASLPGPAVVTSRRRGHGLGSIRESSATSDEQLDTDEEQFSHDGSNCDLSRSWRFGLSRDAVPSRDSTFCSDSSCATVDHIQLTSKEKSNSLPGAYMRPLPADPPRPRPGSTVIRLPSTSEEDSVIASSPPCNPTRPPRAPRTRCPSSPLPPSPTILSSSPGSPRPTMGVLGLQRSPNVNRTINMLGLPPSPRLCHAPKTVAPRSPNNPNPPYGTPYSPLEYPPPGSPRTSSRAGGLVTRNFSISDDENGRRCSKRQVTICRHETAYKEAAEKGYVIAPGSPVDPYWLTWVSTRFFLQFVN